MNEITRKLISLKDASDYIGQQADHIANMIIEDRDGFGVSILASDKICMVLLGFALQNQITVNMRDIYEATDDIFTNMAERVCDRIVTKKDYQLFFRNSVDDLQVKIVMRSEQEPALVAWGNPGYVDKITTAYIEKGAEYTNRLAFELAEKYEGGM